MKKISEIVADLADQLKTDLHTAGLKIEPELRASQLSASDVRRYAQRHSSLVTALKRMSFSHEDAELTLYISQLLILKGNKVDEWAAESIDIASAIVRALTRYDNELLSHSPRDIDVSNVSLPDNAAVLWGFTYNITVKIVQVTQLDASLGQLLELGDLDNFEEAAGAVATPAQESLAKMTQGA